MIAVGTRFFGKDDPVKDLARLTRFIEASSLLGKVHIAVNISEDKCNTIDYCAEHHPDVDVFAVTPWQKFVAPLNAIVYRAALFGADRLLIASAEFAPETELVATLLEYVDNDTIVAGACFSDHEFLAGCNHGNGVTVPWNTFAVWNLGLLANIGFPLLGDAAFDVRQAGVEEVTAIALFQKLFGPEGAKAKLVQIPGFCEEWNMEDWGAERIANHKKKIFSKKSRPATQLTHARWQDPIVHHIVHHQ